MSWSNLGHQEELLEDNNDERQISVSLPSTSYLIDSPTFLPDDLLGFTEDFSLLFPDDHPASLESSRTTNIDVSGVQLGQDQQTSTNAGPLAMAEMKKKMDHNAKERARRHQLNAAYLTLGSLLPDSNKPKEKWSAPYIIDRALHHIPRLEDEIAKLKLTKKEMQSQLEKAQPILRQETNLSVTINELRKGDIIIQVCHPRIPEEADHALSDLLCGLETLGMEVCDASAFYPCEGRCCYHIHIKMDESYVGDDYAAELKEKVVSWLS